MRALVWDGSRLFVAHRPAPRPGPGEALVKVRVAGICNTDLEIVRGYMGFTGVLGHEFVGIVTEGPPRWVGRRVVSEINLGCNACALCARGLARHCRQRQVLGIEGKDGAFAEQVTVPVRNLHEVPDELPDDVAVFTEPLAAAYEILEQVPVGAGTSALVLGDGKLGLLVAQVLATAGAWVRVVGRHDEHLDILRARGIEAVLEECWDRVPARLVVDATGTAAGLTMAMSATEPQGTLVLKTTVVEPTLTHLAPIVVDELTVVGSRCGPFEPALEALRSRRIDVEPLITDRLPLNDGVEAMARADEPGVLKVLVVNE